MKKYKYFLFDLDGTLIDTAPGVTQCVRYALSFQGVTFPEDDDLRRFVGPPLRESFPRECGLSPEETADALTKYQERYSETGIYESALIPGIPALLEGLRSRGGRLATASCKPEHMVRKILDLYDLSPWFDAIVGSNWDGTRVTKEEVIREVFARLAIGSEEQDQVLMIGDRSYDMLGAKKCGIDCLGAYIGYAEPGELEEAGANWVAASMEEMTRLLWEAAEA